MLAIFVALFLLYDVTNKASFDNISAWLAEINEYAQDDVVIMLIGNKADMSSERTVRREDGETIASEFGVEFLETSAKTSMNVELAFKTIARNLKMKKTRRSNDSKVQVAASGLQESGTKPGGCCS